MMRRTARRHETLAAQKLAGTDPTIYSFAQPGDHVRTIDGLGIVADVYDGPVAGAESYYVILDDGLGEGEYGSKDILEIVPDTVTVTSRRYSQTPMACDVCGAPASKSRSGGRDGHTMLCTDCETERDRQKATTAVSSSRGPDAEAGRGRGADSLRAGSAGASRHGGVVPDRGDDPGVRRRLTAARLTVTITKSAHADYMDLQANDRSQVLRGIKAYQRSDSGDITKVKGVTPPTFRLRVGKIRVLFLRDGNHITIFKIGYRGDLGWNEASLKIASSGEGGTRTAARADLPLLAPEELRSQGLHTAAESGRSLAPVLRTTLGAAVGHVLSVGAETQVVGVHATSVVAGVHDLQVSGVVDEDHVRQTVGRDQTRPGVKVGAIPGLPVPSPVSGPSPLPASAPDLVGDRHGAHEAHTHRTGGRGHVADHTRTAARADLPLMSPEELREAGLRTAADDYEQLGEILWERPDLIEAQPAEGMPRRLTLGSKTAEVIEPDWLKKRRSNPIKDSLNDKNQPWWWRKVVGPAMDRYNDAVPPNRQIQDYDDIHKVDTKSWCRFRRKGECYFPKEFDEQGSAEAGYAVWIPFNRGECPWKSWDAQKHDCKVSEPGPESGERTRYPDATVSWSAGGQRLSSLTETPVTITRKTESAWVDIREKAKRIRQAGGVRVIAVADNSVTGEVKGDTGLYTATITTVPGSNQVALATCSCPWETYRWARSGPWKKLEGRACAHITALLYEMQARKMFGGEITEDAATPEWRTEQPALENPKSQPGPWRLDVAASVQGHLAAITAQRDAMEARAAVAVHLDPQALSLGVAVANLVDDETGAGALVSLAKLTEARSLIDIPPFYAQVSGEIIVVDGFDEEGTPWADGRPLSKRQIMYPTYHPTLGITGSLDGKLALYDDLVDLGKVNPDKYSGETTMRKGDWGYYSREQALLDNGFPKGQLFSSEEAMRRYIETVARQEGVTEPIEVTWVWWGGEAGTVWANDWSRARMGFGDGTRYEAVALHELAHLILRKKRKKAPSSHGSEFAAEHARLIEKYMGITLQTGFNPMDFAAKVAALTDRQMELLKRIANDPRGWYPSAKADVTPLLDRGLVEQVDGKGKGMGNSPLWKATADGRQEAGLGEETLGTVLMGSKEYSLIEDTGTHYRVVDKNGRRMLIPKSVGKLAKTAAHSGCMVALVPGPEVAASIALAAAEMEGVRAEPAEEVHLTLAYLGKAADIDRATFLAAVQGIAAVTGELLGVTSGWGTFENETENVLWASVDVPGIDVMRSLVVEGLSAAGLPVATNHGFTPHMTAAYSDDPIISVPTTSVAGMPLHFTSLVAAHNGDWTYFDLTSPTGEAVLGETKTGALDSEIPVAGYTHAGLIVKAVDSGRVLMTQRSPYHGDDEETKGTWEFPGGSIEEGETPLQAALREFGEETGLTLPEGYQIEGSTGNADGTYLSIVVLVPNEAWTVNADLLPMETMGIGWFHPDHVEETPITRPEVDDTDWDSVKEASLQVYHDGQWVEVTTEVLDENDNAILSVERWPDGPKYIVEAFGVDDDDDYDKNIATPVSFSTEAEARQFFQKRAMFEPRPDGEVLARDGEIVYRRKSMLDDNGVEAWAADEKLVGQLIWERSGERVGEIQSVDVLRNYRRRGIATKMFELAKQVEPRVHHSNALTDDGKAWSKTVAVQKAAVSNSYRYHLTSKVDFKLDPKKRPENNTTLGGDWQPGIFLTTPDGIGHWAQGYGYWRPWVVEFDIGSAKPLFEEGYEAFYTAEEYPKIRVLRVLPLDAFCREQYGAWGWTEEDTGLTFDTMEPYEDKSQVGTATSWDDVYPWRNWHYSGDARNESASWRDAYVKRVRSYARSHRGVIASLDVEAEAEAILHDEPQPALPEALGAYDTMDPDLFGGQIEPGSSVSPRSTPADPFEQEPTPVYDPVGIQNLGGVDPRVAWLLDEAPQGGGDDDIALAAQAALAKMALKTFSIEEQHELIHEGAEDHRGARNTDRLSIAGTHYEYDAPGDSELELETLW